ncbi:hypothetical protein [Alteromonas sp. a30]|uniref:hypothetical protein n=1 Tax=Alteromonas sp. a30 TaxID=2730917 RepID=UPI002280109B|nr:hypothetical protein [Alteromonas sp. a30]MCY7296222.1 hypothetical protein [Alteromonas sp. a30]
MNKHLHEPTQARFSKYEAKYGAHHSQLLSEPVLSDVLTKGYCVIPQYWSAEKCQAARQAIDSLTGNAPPTAVKLWTDELRADKRIMGSNYLMRELNLFDDAYITEVIQALYGVETLYGFSMAAKLESCEGNLGSGQGWHRDSCIEHQFKAILYLSDVDSQHGPFQYYRQSGNAQNIVEFETKTHIPVDESRLSAYESAFDLAQIDELCASEGTLIIANTRGIHRGKPIQTGTRYALTNYYWKRAIPAHIAQYLNDKNGVTEHQSESRRSSMKQN